MPRYKRTFTEAIRGTPADLAATVVASFPKKARNQLKVEAVTDLLEAMYYASLRSEEGQPITFHVVYLNPKDPDPNPPKRIVRDRWIYTALENAIPLTSSAVVKISRCSDPRSSAFVVFPNDSGAVQIWGVIDQQNRYHDFLNFDSESGPERPGLFQAFISGIGKLVVTAGYEKIAELRIDKVVTSSIDVLRSGPVSGILNEWVAKYLDVGFKYNVEQGNKIKPIDTWIGVKWLETLCRLLVRIQGFRHGGAILLTPDQNFSGLTIKYKVMYDRLKHALEKHSKLQLEQDSASDEIYDKYLHKQADFLPMDLYLDDAISKAELEDSRSEIDGALWFVALLSRVDGLVLMTPSLEVHGFGVEIIYREEPGKVMLASDAAASEENLTQIQFQQFGMRHRSMMRYCVKHEGSLGIVISQDGDVRFMTKMGDRLIVWENIRLQYHDFATRRRRSRIRKNA